MKTVFDPAFKYKRALETDIGETFKRVRKEQEERAKKEAEDARKQLEAKVAQINSVRK